MTQIKLPPTNPGRFSDCLRRGMRQMDLHTITKRKFKHATDSAHDKAISPSLLNQIFSMSTPDAVWVGDITYIRLGQKLFILPSSLLFARVKRLAWQWINA